MRRTLIATVEPPLEGVPQWSIGAMALCIARALEAQGGAAAIATPAHPLVERETAFDGRQIVLPAGSGMHGRELTIREGQLPSGVQVYAVSSGGTFADPGVYELKGGERSGPCARFALFCGAVIQIAQRLAPPPQEVVLCEWPCAPAAALLRRGGFPIESAVLVAEPQFQGLMDWEEARTLDFGLPAERLALDTGEFYGRFSMLKYGLVHSTRLLGLTPRHAQFLCREAAALEGLFTARRDALQGFDPSVFLAAAQASALRSAQAAAPPGSGQQNRIRLHDEGAPTALLDAVFRLLPHMEEMGLSLVAGDAALARCPAGQYGALRYPDALLPQAETPDAACGVHVFLDTESVAPFSPVRAWLAGHVVCAPASPALTDALESAADPEARARLFPFQASTDLALLDVILAATRAPQRPAAVSRD